MEYLEESRDDSNFTFGNSYIEFILFKQFCLFIKWFNEGFNPYYNSLKNGLMEQLSSNEHLMYAFNRGDVSAFNALYRQFSRPLFYYARKLVQEPEAEDIVSVCFVKLWERRTDFPTVQQAKSFLFIATRNACFNSLRTSQQLSDSQREFHYLMEDSEEVFHHEISTELLQLIQKDIAGLAPQRKKILELFLAGWSEREIAGELQIAPKTVRNQKAHAIQILRNRLVNKVSLFLTGVAALPLQFFH